MHYVRYKPRVNLGIISERIANGGGRVRYALPTRQVAPVISPTVTATPTTSKISPPAWMLEPRFSTMPVTITPPPGVATELPMDISIPETFRYSPEQLRDMLMRGASETYDRSGEDENGLPLATDLEQRSREMDATKQFAIDKAGGVLPATAVDATPGQALGWAAAALIGYLLLGG